MWSQEVTCTRLLSLVVVIYILVWLVADGSIPITVYIIIEVVHSTNYDKIQQYVCCKV